MRSFNVVSFPRKRESRARHARPSLDARFRGHDTDVSESSPHFERLTRLAACEGRLPSLRDGSREIDALLSVVDVEPDLRLEVVDGVPLYDRDADLER